MMWRKTVDDGVFTGPAHRAFDGLAAIHMTIAGTQIAVFQMLVSFLCASRNFIGL
jgi:hypothetical protein